MELLRCCDLVAHMSVEGGDGLGKPEGSGQLGITRVNKISLPKSALCPAMARWQAGIIKEYVGWYVGKCRVSLKSQYANKRPIE